MANEKKFMDQAGTGYLWSKITQQLANKANSDDLATLAGRVTTAEGEIDDLQALHASGKTVAQEVSDGISALNLSTTYAAKAYESKVDTLIGTDTDKSVRTIANEELVARLITADADESLDTLSEIAAWIQDHPGSAAEMNEKITALQNKTELGTHAVTTYILAGEGAKFDPGVAYYTDNTGTSEVDTTGFEQDITDVSEYYVATVTNPQYATVKAYVESMITASSHTHTNKAVLDGITSALITNWNAAYTKAHEHSNKSVLDGITSEKVTAWDAAEQNAKTYAAGLAVNYATAAQGTLADTALQPADVIALSTAEIDAAIASANSNSDSNSGT